MIMTMMMMNIITNYRCDEYNNNNDHDDDDDNSLIIMMTIKMIMIMMMIKMIKMILTAVCCWCSSFPWLRPWNKKNDFEFHWNMFFLLKNIINITIMVMITDDLFCDVVSHLEDILLTSNPKPELGLHWSDLIIIVIIIVEIL